MNLELCAFLTQHALGLYLPTYSGDHLQKDFDYLCFLFFIPVVLVKTVYLHTQEIDLGYMNN